MAQSATSRFAQSLHRRCMARPIGAALMALALGGVIAGGAMALSPTVDTALVFRGGVNIMVDATAFTNALAYTVPAGRKFMLTDLVIANSSETSAAVNQNVFTKQFDSCAPGGTPSRTNELSIPAGSTLHLPFVTGIGFTAGQGVCINNGDSTDTTHWTIRGYLFD
jgi:hypothetical protein